MAERRIFIRQFTKEGEIMMAKPSIPDRNPVRREVPDFPSPEPERTPVVRPVPAEPVKTPKEPVPVRR